MDKLTVIDILKDKGPRIAKTILRENSTLKGQHYLISKLTIKVCSHNSAVGADIRINIQTHRTAKSQEITLTLCSCQGKVFSTDDAGLIAYSYTNMGAYFTQETEHAS